MFILLTQLKRKLKKADDQNAHLKGDVQSLTTVVTEKHEENLKLRKKVTDMEADRQKQENDFKELKKDLAKKNIEEKKKEKKLKGYFKQVADLKFQLEESNRAVGEHVNKIDELEEILSMEVSTSLQY